MAWWWPWRRPPTAEVERSRQLADRAEQLTDRLEAATRELERRIEYQARKQQERKQQGGGSGNARAGT
jgi:hypothetical protein